MDLTEKYSKIKSHNSEFFDVFGMRLFDYHDIYGFNIIEFDDDLKRRFGNYEDGKTSMKDFIKQKFGNNGVELIEKILEY